MPRNSNNFHQFSNSSPHHRMHTLPCLDCRRSASLRCRHSSNRRDKFLKVQVFLLGFEKLHSQIILTWYRRAVSETSFMADAFVEVAICTIKPRDCLVKKFPQIATRSIYGKKLRNAEC